MIVEVLRVSGEELRESLDEVARLRIEVFREYPYLYEGSEVAEQEYLECYATSPRAVLVLARAGCEVIGASTGMPLVEADEAFQLPFVRSGELLDDWFYLGESVLRGEFRGKGVGHRFFEEREAHAIRLGFRKVAFCSVVRPEGHSLKPENYRPHDLFWKKRGYEIRPDWRACLGWRQVDSVGEDVRNELVFWTKQL
jgi:GNAT superfamily N-acetyltransferase